MNNLSKKILSFFKNKKKPIYLHEPSIDKKDINEVSKCISSKMISSKGNYVKKFEEKIKKFTKSKYCTAVSNGTVGIFLSLKCLDIKEQDEVLVPAITFVATANAVRHCGAVPHFVDIKLDHLSIDVDKLDKYLQAISIKKNGYCFNKNTNRYIKAIIPVHIFGHSCDIDNIIKISKKYNFKIVEDATEALGSFYKNKHLGNYGDLGVFSFNGNKIISTGGGGAIVTNNKKLASKVNHLASTAKVAHPYRYIHDEIGYNFKLPAINASLGCSQISKLKLLIKKKRELYFHYKNFFKNVDGIKLVSNPKKCVSNFWLQTIILDKNNLNIKEKIIKDCHRYGVYVRPVWDILPKLKMYKKCPKMNLSASKEAYNSIINLPSSSNLV